MTVRHLKLGGGDAGAAVLAGLGASAAWLEPAMLGEVEWSLGSLLAVALLIPAQALHFAVS